MKKSVTLLSVKVVLLLLLISAFMVACGASSGTGPTTQTTATSAVTGSSPTASPVAASCGTISLAPTGTLVNATVAQQVGNCFWQAFITHCQTASLEFSVGGVDTVKTHLFSTQKTPNACSISDAVQTRIGPRAPQSTQSFTCAQVNNTGDALNFQSCGGDGDVRVPIR